MNYASELLSLQLPISDPALALATIFSPGTLRILYREVFKEYVRRRRLATHAAEAVVYRTALERLRRFFSRVDPETWSVEEEWHAQ